jgi:hypothetical protein
MNASEERAAIDMNIDKALKLCCCSIFLHCVVISSTSTRIDGVVSKGVSWPLCLGGPTPGPAGPGGPRAPPSAPLDPLQARTLVFGVKGCRATGSALTDRVLSC